MASNYKILDIDISLVQEIEGSAHDSSEGVPHKRVTKLMVQSSYEYLTLLGEEQGNLSAELCTICEVEFDKDGNATSFTKKDVPTYDDVISKVEEEIEKRIKSYALIENERSYSQNILLKTKALESDEGDQLPHRYTRNTGVESYTDLSEFI